jgi:AcrR family transcriptional regulator
LPVLFFGRFLERTPTSTSSNSLLGELWGRPRTNCRTHFANVGPVPPSRAKTGAVAKRPVGRPPLLDRAMIARAACEVGLDRLTMRSVAEHLGVSVPGLYHHVKGRDEMIRLAAEHSASLIGIPEDRGQHWAEWLLEWAQHARQAFVSQPELLEQFLQGTIGLKQMVDHIDTVVGVLVRQGFSPRQAMEAYLLVSHSALGAAMSEIRESEASLAGRPVQAEYLQVLAQRGPDELTNLRQLLDAPPIGPPSFEDQLCTVLVGIAVRRGEPWQPVVALATRAPSTQDPPTVIMHL